MTNARILFFLSLGACGTSEYNFSAMEDTALLIETVGIDDQIAVAWNPEVPNELADYDILRTSTVDRFEIVVVAVPAGIDSNTFADELAELDGVEWTEVQPVDPKGVELIVSDPVFKD